MRYTSEDKYIVVGAKGYSNHPNWNKSKEETIDKIEYDEDTGKIRRVRFSSVSFMYRWWSHKRNGGTIFVQYKPSIVRRNK